MSEPKTVPIRLPVVDAYGETFRPVRIAADWMDFGPNKDNKRLPITIELHCGEIGLAMDLSITDVLAMVSKLVGCVDQVRDRRRKK
ncbi:MAG: hypothetical protein F9K32_16635 [Desulfobulbaceae bacterium]|nr:MAG: hypothetical protein F9K32_16635 [Desulfobulbaceae bacterium]